MDNPGADNNNNINKAKVLKYIKLRYADPICTMDLNDQALLYGTMIGTAVYYIISRDKLITLSETQDEHISGVSLKDDKFFVSVGDEKVFLYNISDSSNDIPNHNEMKNYESEADHLNKCDNCYTMLNDIYLVRTFINFPSETKTPSESSPTDYSIKDLTNLTERRGTITMSNYSVPFDFDGNNYIFVDFFDGDLRIFNIYNENEKRIIFSREFKKENIGKPEYIAHISHCKILKGDKLFLCQDFNICEIRDMQLNKIKRFNEKGEEVLAFDVFYEDDEGDSFKIIILDLKCNVILFDYKSGKEEFLFNLEDLSGIDQIVKDQRFFSMGYPYYIKISKKYLAISSDYGCLILEHCYL